MARRRAQGFQVAVYFLDTGRSPGKNRAARGWRQGPSGPRARRYRANFHWTRVWKGQPRGVIVAPPKRNPYGTDQPRRIYPAGTTGSVARDMAYPQGAHPDHADGVLDGVDSGGVLLPG